MLRSPSRRLALVAGVLLVSACEAPPAGGGAEGSPATEAAMQAWLALERASTAPATVEWDRERRVARAASGDFAAPPGTPVESARAFLARHGAVFGMADDRDLVVSSVHESLVGWHVRFRQHVAGLEVEGVEVSVHLRRAVPSDRVFQVRSDYVAGLTVTAPRLGAAAAATVALAAAEAASSPAGTVEAAALVVLPDGRAGWRVDVRREEPARLLRVLVAADDGTVVSQRDLLWHSDGTGWVFDPNPVASTGDTSLQDNGDADSAALTAARVPVTLRDLDGSGTLTGPYVNAFNKNTRALEPTLVFDYTRTNDFFEEVMAYYHLDRAQRRLQALGFTNVMNRRIEAAVNGTKQDNSWFDSAKNTITYGSGGVDDAEDADVILHEYGHAIQDDQVPGFGGNNEAGAMGEGFGDFFASVPHVTLGPCLIDTACVMAWDATTYATSRPPCLRRLDGTKHNPEFADGEVHDDGELWSAALWEGALALGHEKMLREVLQSHFALGPNATFQDGARAVMQADQLLEAGANQETLRRIFTWRGLLADITPPSSYAGPWVSVPRQDQSPHPYPNLLDQWFDVSHPGAEAIRVRFASFDTQAASDHVYLYDPQVHLYAVHSGTLGPFTSVAVPGDTVRVRLVTDSKTTRAGYVIDAYEVPVEAIPDGGQVDAATQDDAASPDDAAPQDDAATQDDAAPQADGPLQDDAAAQDDAVPQADGPLQDDAAAQSDAAPGDGGGAEGGADAIAATDAFPGSDGGTIYADRGCACRAGGRPGPRGGWASALVAVIGLGLRASGRRRSNVRR
ncbi:MAG: M36 family metallopeptidase [Deltaproteobacteria bacterium]|nr:M36 family metallopeptidase [Deltaproteobacteria bacterium]